MIKANQFTAARALLNWSREDLSKHSGIHIETIKKIELGLTDNPRAYTIDQILSTFSHYDIEFIDGGVREKQNLVQVLDGEQGIKKFFDDVYSVVSKLGGDILISGIDEDIFWNEYRFISETHAQRMAKLLNFNCLCLVCKSNKNINNVIYADYRVMPEDLFENVPFYIYGSKLAIILWEPKPKIILLNNQDMVKAYSKQFMFLWKKSRKINPK